MFRSQIFSHPTKSKMSGSLRKVVYQPFTARVNMTLQSMYFGSWLSTHAESVCFWCVMQLRFPAMAPFQWFTCTGQRSNKKPTFMLKCRIHVEKATWFIPLLSILPVICQWLVLKKLARVSKINEINHFGNICNLELLGLRISTRLWNHILVSARFFSKSFVQ